MCEANGFDPGKETHLRDQMVELIKIVEGFYACGVAASTCPGRRLQRQLHARAGVFQHRQAAAGQPDLRHAAHRPLRVGGLIVTLPGPDEDHNPVTAARLADVLRAAPDVPYDKRIQTARFMEDLTASYQAGWYSVISLHGGGSPAAMKQEIWRHYPVGDKVALVERLLDRGVAADPSAPSPTSASLGAAVRRAARRRGGGDDGSARAGPAACPEGSDFQMPRGGFIRISGRSCPG
jgi:4-hydroxybutyryl-CoA dehydratase/vinylacetyl-CoA-Delta-isomerase